MQHPDRTLSEIWVDLLVGRGVGWIAAQREKHRESARPLEPMCRAALGRFFASDTLDSVRVRLVTPWRASRSSTRCWSPKPR
jgi:hypothetical protein